MAITDKALSIIICQLTQFVVRASGARKRSLLTTLLRISDARYKMVLSVIIVSYNTQQLLRECLASVQANLSRSDLMGQVWVVDNASLDDSAHIVAREFPQVQLIANEDNVGFAAANNQALRAMGFGKSSVSTPHSPLPAYVFLLNPDTLVRDNALGTLVRFMEDNLSVGAVGAGLVHPDGPFQHSAFSFPTLPQVFFDFFPINYRLIDSRLNGRYPRRLYETGKPFPIDHPLGAALMVRREAVEGVGLLDERFFIYCEEIDWCMRIKRAGWAVFCVPEARIVHYVAQSTSQFPDEMFVQLWRSRYSLFGKHYSRFFRWAARRIVRLGLRREMWELYRQARRGEIDGNELEKRLRACQQVMEM